MAVAATGRGGGMTLLTSSCDPSATSSAVLFRSSGVVPLLQFILRVDSLRDGVLFVHSSVVNRDRCPQFPSSDLVSGCCSTLTRSSMCLETQLFALWRLVEGFHIFSSCCSRCSPEIWTLFLELLVYGSQLPLCVANKNSNKAFDSSVPFLLWCSFKAEPWREAHGGQAHG